MKSWSCFQLLSQLQPSGPGKDASPPTRLAFVGANAPAPFLFACDPLQHATRGGLDDGYGTPSLGPPRSKRHVGALNDPI